MSNQSERASETGGAGEGVSSGVGGGDLRRRGVTPYLSRRAARARVESSRRTLTFTIKGVSGEPTKSIDPSPYQDGMNRRLRRAHMSPRSVERVSSNGARVPARRSATYDGRFGILIPAVPR